MHGVILEKGLMMLLISLWGMGESSKSAAVKDKSDISILLM